MGREIGPELTYLPVLGFLRGGNVSASCPPPAPGRCFGVVSIWKGRPFHGDTLGRQSVKDKCCYFHLLRWVNCRIFTSSLKSVSNLSFFSPFSPAHHPASCCHSISGKVSLSLANHSGALAVFVRLWREGVRVRSWKNVLSFLAAAFLTSDFFFFFLTAALLLSPLCPRGPALLLSPCPTSVLQCWLMWTFPSVRAKMCASVCSASVLWLWGRF